MNEMETQNYVRYVTGIMRDVHVRIRLGSSALGRRGKKGDNILSRKMLNFKISALG